MSAGIPAARDDERHKQREDNSSQNLLLEEAHRSRRQHLPQKQHDQPSRPLPHHAKARDLQVWLIKRFRAAEELKLPRGRFFGDVKRIVYGHDANQL